MPISKKTATSAADKFVSSMMGKPSSENSIEPEKNAQSKEVAEVVIPKRPRAKTSKITKTGTTSSEAKPDAKKSAKESDANKIKVTYYSTKEQHFQLRLYALQNNTEMTSIISTLVEDFLKKNVKE
jgi:hypothetical protein